MFAAAAAHTADRSPPMTKSEKLLHMLLQISTAPGHPDDVKNVACAKLLQRDLAGLQQDKADGVMMILFSTRTDNVRIVKAAMSRYPEQHVRWYCFTARSPMPWLTHERGNADENLMWREFYQQYLLMADMVVQLMCPEYFKSDNCIWENRTMDLMLTDNPERFERCQINCDAASVARIQEAVDQQVAILHRMMGMERHSYRNGP